MKRKYLTLTIWVAAAALVLLCGTAVARMFRQTEPLDNQFDTAVVDCVVHEKLGTDAEYTSGTQAANQKTSIKVENTGNIDAYIRVRFVSYWVNAEGNIVGKASVMPAIACSGDWVSGANDTYYHKKPVAPGAFTAELLTESIVLKTEDGYDQVVEVFADAIQSLPESAATEKWGVSIENGNITGS